jgi:hypothetical protein
MECGELWAHHIGRGLVARKHEHTFSNERQGLRAMSNDIREEAKHGNEFPCRICGKASVVDVTNNYSAVEAGSYCSTHAPKLDPPHQMEAA